MKKTDNQSNISDKKSTQGANQSANDAYEKALTGVSNQQNQKSKKTHSHNQNKAKSPQARQQERRARHQNISPKQQRRLRQTKNNSVQENNNQIHLRHEEDDSYDEEKKKNLFDELESGHQSRDKKQNTREDNDDDNHIKDTDPDDKHFMDHCSQQAQERTTTTHSQNSAQYMSLLKEFNTQNHAIDDDAFHVQKDMVQETIIHMFDQFKIGFDNFPKSSRQHEIFGKGLHLCQKILIAFKRNEISQAKQLIEKLIPKSSASNK